MILRIVDRAAGNAFYLEELMRAAAESRRDDDVSLPETVLAMVQARLEAMEPEARQLLRAASVFGQVFWSGAVRALLGGELDATTAAGDWLEELVRREVVTERRSAKFYGENEYVFRHAIVRDAAYAMLTDADRELGHRLAGEWLERVGEPEALVLAEHFERGGQRARAASWWRRAAEQALGGNDLSEAIARMNRGIACMGDDAEAHGRLRLIEAEARNWRGEFPDAERAGGEAMQRLQPGSDAWYAALGETAQAAGVRGKSDVLADLSRQLDEAGGVEGAEIGDRQVLAATRLAEQLIITGSAEQATRLLLGLERLAVELREMRPGLAGRILSALALRRRYAGDAGAAHKLAEEGIACFDRAGDRRNSLLQRGRLGYAHLEMGDFAEAERLLSQVASEADGMGLLNVASTARHNLGLTLARLGRFQEARTVESAAASEFRASGNRRMEGASLEYLALIELAAGDALSAEAAARGALHVASIEPALPLNQAESLAILGRTLLGQKRVAEALEVARRGMRMLEELGGIDDGEAIIRLTLAESLWASGDHDAARSAIGSARDRLLLRAGKILDERQRQVFLQQVPENEKTLQLAAAWSGAS
jgi:tetratricopeptide (TPR) repeat protein